MIVPAKRVARRDLLATYFWVEYMRVRGIRADRVGTVYVRQKDNQLVISDWAINNIGDPLDQAAIMDEWRAFEEANADDARN